MVIVITAFIGYFSEFGLTAGLIQKKEIDSLDTNSVFWSTVAISVILYFLMYLAAPLVAVFYHEPRLTIITQVVFINFIVMPLNFIPDVMETKKLEYAKMSIAELLSVFVSGIVAIVLAYMNFGVWCLVWQSITKTGSRAVIIIFLTRWKPKFEFSWLRLKPLLNSGIHFTLTNLFMFTYENIDYLLVGKLLGKTPLGLYTMAFRLSKYPILKVQAIFGRMLFPLFSTFNDDPDRIKRNFTQLLVIFLTWMTPVLIFGYFVSEPVIYILLGEKWADTIPLVKIFMIYLVFSSFCIQNNPILGAINRIKIWNLVQMISTIFLGIFGFIGIKYAGISGMAIAFTVVTSISLLIVFVIIIRILNIPISTIAGSISVLLIIILAVLLILMDLLINLWTSNNWVRIILPGLLLTVWLLVVNKSEITKLYQKFKIYKMDLQKIG
jgi:O-antigen/teichoic acid export membrane protein